MSVAKSPKRKRYVTCECGCRVAIVVRRWIECPSCQLYNAAVDAIQAAAKRIALDSGAMAAEAYMNEYGVFARVGLIVEQVGTPAQAAPFVALTKAARAVRFEEQDHA